MSVLNGVRSVFFVVLLLLSAQSVAAGRMDKPVSSFDNEDEEKPWAEIEMQLPAFPENENLIAFKVGAVEQCSFGTRNNVPLKRYLILNFRHQAVKKTIDKRLTSPFISKQTDP